MAVTHFQPQTAGVASVDGSYGMTDRELTSLRAALSVLQRLLPSGAVSPQATDEPLHRFVRHYLVPDPQHSLTTVELTEFHEELAGLGHVPRLPRQVLQRRLASAIYICFGLRRSHNIDRHGKHRRGYRGLWFSTATT